MTLTTFEVSPFLCLGDETFMSARGQSVVPVYLTDRATMVLVPSNRVDLLLQKSVELDADEPHVGTMIRMGLIGDSRERFRQNHYQTMESGSQPGKLRSFTLLPTSYCNMGCSYCGQAHTKKSLAPNHREAVVERVLSTISDPEVDSVHVAWFGGEPLMAFAALRSMSRQFTDRIDATGTAYSSKMTTNGALLDDRKLRTLVQDCRVGRFDITLDGPAHIHDRHRPLKSGQPTFARLTEFLARVTAEPFCQATRFVLRTNVDSQNIKFVDQYLETMAEMGFAGRKNVLFQLSAIHPFGNDISELEAPRSEVVEAEIAWFDKLQALGLNYVAIPSQVVANTCVATNPDHEVVDADGRIFSCTEHPLVPATAKSSTLTFIGDLGTTRRRPQGEFDDWAATVAGGGAQCSSCWLLPVCGGACPKQWADGKVPCPTMKVNLPERLSVVARGLGMRSLGARSGGQPSRV